MNMRELKTITARR